MSKLLSDRIRDLHLRPNAPYPSEVTDAHRQVLQWRLEQRLRLVKEELKEYREPEDKDDE